MQHPLVRGRGFRAEDAEDAAGAVVVSEAMARRFWPGEDPLGRRIRVRGRTREAFEIVGVARDVKHRDLWEDPRPFLYLPLLQRYFAEMTAHVRGPAALGSWLPAVRQSLAELDPEVHVFAVRPLGELPAAAVEEQRFAAAVLGGAGVLASFLAVFGLYAVAAYVVTQRTYELAIRLALGASRKDVMTLVFVQCGLPILGGLAAGAVAAVWLGRFVKGFVFGVSVLDPASFVVSGLALAAAGFAALYAPAARAARVDPLMALRAE